jgi:tRNA pseudouridine32 synthase/23S rRNA pseudouridine746 synthase
MKPSLIFWKSVSHKERGSGWERRMHEGKVLNAQGEKISPDTPYTPNQTIFYYRELKSETKIPFQEKIIYEDDWIVVADKPHFIPVTPIGPYLKESLLVRLRNRLGIDQLNPVHRLDLETAGLVLFTKQAHTRNTYAALFRDRSVKKQYLAVAPSSTLMDWPIIRSSRIETSNRFMQMHEVDGIPNTSYKNIGSRNNRH